MAVIVPRFCKTLEDCFVEILTSSLEPAIAHGMYR